MSALLWDPAAPSSNSFTSTIWSRCLLMADRRITETCGLEKLDRCKAFDISQFAGINPVYDPWWMSPPLSLKAFLSLSGGNAAESRQLMLQEWHTLPPLILNKLRERLNGWEILPHSLNPLNIHISPLSRFKGGEIILFRPVWACSGFIGTTTCTVIYLNPRLFYTVYTHI